MEMTIQETGMDLKGLQATAKSIRALAMDAVQSAESGHPGLPMGCAEIGASLYGEYLVHNPDDPHWLGRDRFILSAGHGSMLAYSLLHLSGYDVSLDDIKKFRQLGSLTPGHPEFDLTPGIETTTGPLGQGMGNAVGMALAAKIQAARFNRPGYKLFTNRVVVLAGDGDMMEGVTYESCSLAGHHKLNNLIAIFDSNSVTIEGSTDLAFSEDVSGRFKAMNWSVLTIDGNDFTSISEGLVEADGLRITSNQPVLIIAKTIIGKGAPGKQGTSACHGAPLGKEECALAKKALGIEGDFYIDPYSIEYLAGRKKDLLKIHSEWNELFSQWSEKHPDLRKELDRTLEHKFDKETFKSLPDFKAGDMIATRSASGTVLNAVTEGNDFLISGSADLGSSVKTEIKNSGTLSPDDYTARNMQYGIREHGMGAIANGIYLYGGVIPVVSTFLAFMPYMIPSMRMAAMMSLPIIYVFSHDSIFVGEDGPTHQPVEHLSTLRMLPSCNVMRPADANETKVAWELALTTPGTPSVIVTTRQNVPVLDDSFCPKGADARRGGYIFKKESGNKPDLVILASGSEVAIALDAAERLEKEGKSIRVVNMFSMYLFELQDEAYRKEVLPPEYINRLAVEAGVDDPWYRYIGLDGKTLTINRFGASGKATDVRDYFGMNADGVYAIASKMV
jgi:transketolase